MEIKSKPNKPSEKVIHSDEFPKNSEEKSCLYDSGNFSSNENNDFNSKCENNLISDHHKTAVNVRDFIANDKKGKSIHSKFLYLKRQLNLGHFMRKTQIDSLLKKCKSKAFKNIHEALRKCLSLKLEKLPQLFITNIKIEFNKHYLNKTIIEIYQEFNIIKNLEDLNSKGYVIESRRKVLEDFLCLTFKQVFEYYINSHQFKKDYLQVSEKEGQNFAILFSFIAQVFIQYYQKSRGNQKKNNFKHIKANKFIDIKTYYEEEIEDNCDDYNNNDNYKVLNEN